MTKVCRIMGMKPREILAVDRDSAGRLIVTTHDGNVNVICGPDRAVSDPPAQYEDLEPGTDPAQWDAEQGRPWIGKPDADGQRGVLFDEHRSGRPAPKGAAIFVDPHRPVAQAALWTADDLDQEARRYLGTGRMPAPERAATNVPGRGGQATSELTRMPWVGIDPIRARAVWLHLADQRRVSPSTAVGLYGEAMRCRAVIADSGWLSHAEMDKL